MGIEDKIKNFRDRYDESKDKERLLTREIEAYEMLFDEKKLPLSTNVISSSRPIKYLNTYTHHDIVLIREVYQKYIVNGTNIDEAWEWFRVNRAEHKDDDSIIIDAKGKTFKKFPQNSSQLHYYNEANMLFEYLNFLKDKSSIFSSTTNSSYTVKSIIIAYFYMYKKGIYPIPEIVEVGKKIEFYKGLEKEYHLTYKSFKTDWKPLEDKSNRLANPENIKLAIKLLNTINDPKIKEAIELANCELKESELKS
jgi:hypothetical protein